MVSQPFLILLIICALALPAVVWFAPVPATAALGALLIIAGLVYRGLRGGVLTAIWCTMAIVTKHLFTPDMLKHGILVALSLYFVMGVGIGLVVDTMRRRVGELNETIRRLEQVKEEYEQSEKRYRRLFESSLDGVYRSTPGGKFLDVNPALVKMLGYDSKEELLQVDIRKDLYVSRKDRPDPDKRNSAFTARLKRKDGSEIWVETTPHVVYDTNGHVVHYEGIVRDITERKRWEERVRYLGFHDMLTGLYNRAYFEEELKRLDTERQLPLSLIMADVNALKLVNDAFGHHRGDQLLKKMAGIIRRSCRKEDVVARWGGDEFIMLLPRTTGAVSERICERVKKACNEASQDPIQPSVALGAATKTSIEQDIDEVLREAEDCMYGNKLLESRNTRTLIISSLEETMWKKDNETREHIERVKKLALKLGRDLGLGDNQMKELALLAALHDIGKISISNDILLKAGHLSEAEWEIIKRHPETGYHIAEWSHKLAPIAEAILAHHEWWDGSGYPHGLKGEEIPLISRIVSIVDAYDVMTHERPYARTLGQDEAIMEIKKSAGCQFDPVLAEKFANLLARQSSDDLSVHSYNKV